MEQTIKIVAVVLGVIFVLYKLADKVYTHIKMNRVKQLAIDTIMKRNGSSYPFQLESIENIEEIIGQDIKGLQEGLLSGKYTSVMLVHVFGERCQRIGRSLCLSAEENFEDAIKMAEWRDVERQEALQKGDEAVKALGMMHGIPISIKDLLPQKGKLSTVGCAFLCAEEFRAKEDSCTVGLFMQAGAIPLVRGNVPQSALSLHTKNFVFGEARYPMNQERSCGGSSGGEGGLIASRCIPCGLGTDIGGSVRFPAAFCGIYGFKPTNGRVTMKGVPGARRHRHKAPGHLDSVVGPMGSSVDDMIIQSEVIFDPKIHYHDPLRTPMPMNNDQLEYMQNPENFKKIKIGMLDYSDFLGVSDSVKRAMNEAKEALTKVGYEVVPFKFEKHIWDGATKCFLGVVGKVAEDTICKDFVQECEPMLKPLEQNSMINMASNFKKQLIQYVLRNMMDKGRQADLFKYLKKRNFKEYEEFLQYRYEFVYEVAKIWRESGIKALVSPIWPHCGLKHKNSGEMGLMFEYSVIWNVTGFPSGVMPVTRVKENEQTFDDSYKDAWTRVIQEDVQNSVGMPICLQVTGYAFEDENALAVMKVLEKEMKYKMDMNPKIDLDYGEKIFDKRYGYTRIPK